MHIGGVKISISAGFLLLLSAVYLFDLQGLIFYILIAGLIHEAAHLIVLHLLKGRISAIELNMFGVNVTVASYPFLSYGREIAAVLAGPAVSFAVAVTASNLGNFYKDERITYFAGVNFIIAAFNMLPARYLDGGRILQLVLYLFLPPEKADAAVYLCTFIFAAGFLTIGAVVFMRSSGNFTLLMFGVYILSSLIKFKKLNFKKML